MDLELALGRRARVEAFQRKHRLGLLTLLFADVVDSRRLKQELGDEAALSHLARHHSALREILGQFNEAEEINLSGDSFFLVFSKPSDAVRFSLLFQARLRGLAHETGQAILNRIAIHVGEVFISDHAGAKDVYGIQVDVAARLLGLAEAKQIVMTRFAFDSSRQVLRGHDLDGLAPLVWMNHGLYRLKDLDEPIEVCSVAEEGSGLASHPPNSEQAQRYETPDFETVPGWRPAIDQPVPNTHWVLERRLGEGGFGEVWLACHSKLRERRVIKFCFRADRVRSLKREVTLFRVMREHFGHHSRIVGIQEVCFDQPPYYLVMDYARGQDLKGWCAERGGLKEIPRTTLIEIAAQVAEALQTAHEAGVIHRDVKPGNILVSGTGAGPADVQVKLTDFGIGQVVSPEVLAGMTRAGFTQTVGSTSGSGQAGTHIYMAPELIANKPVSTRSDIFSLGVVLYQMLVGDFSQPLTVDWTQEIDDPLLQEDLARCFAGNPLQRWPRAIQLADNLRKLEERRQGRPPPQKESTADAQVTIPETASVDAATAPAREHQPRNIPPRDRGIKSTLIDLTRFYNAALDEDWFGEPGGNLAVLPRGRVAMFAGTEFDLRGLIQLSSQTAKTMRPGLPERVRGISIGKSCHRLHFLHAALCIEADGTRIGSYLLHFSDGQQREFSINYGHELREWCFDYDPVREIRHAIVAWTGRNAGQHPVRLYKCTWENPQPEVEIVSIDFLSAMTDAAPFLIALTIE